MKPLSAPASHAVEQSRAAETSVRTPSLPGTKDSVEATNAELSAIPMAVDDGPTVRKAGRVDAPSLGPGTTLATEVEPNETTATATPIAGTKARVHGNMHPIGDVDFYSFTAAAGDRLYAATMTSFSASTSGDTVLDVYAADGTTLIETDDENGSFNGNSSSIAGATLPNAGTYYIRVTNFNTTATTQILGYDLYFRLQSGSPTAETEPNDTTATAQPLPASGWVSGSTSAATDVDYYSVALNAGDTIYLGLDLDPERDTTTWNGRLGFAQFGTPANILVVNDPGGEAPDSEAFFLTVKSAGTYYAYVDCPSTTFGTYHLSATVIPRTSGSYTTYASTNVPVAISATGTPVVTSTLTVPGNPKIGHLRVNLDITHNRMQDLDVQLTSPTGSTVGLFSDVGSNTAGTQTAMDINLDDDNAIPVNSFTVEQNIAYQPEAFDRLGWLDGTDAGGTWTLTLRDDVTANGGTLNNWSIEILEATPPATCGGTLNTIFSTDFEANDGGFTHTGTADEWEYGTPVGSATNPIGTANSGTKCWKTDLDGTYEVNSNQELSSPQIILPLTGALTLSWAQKYSMESTNFDHAYVEIREVGGAGSVRRLFEHLAGTMQETVGAGPSVVVPYASGWSPCTYDVTDFAGKTVTVVWHVDSDNTVNLSGLAVDDVKVTQCAALPMADLATTLTDSPDPVTVNNNLTYSITSTNNGPDAAASASVSLPLPTGTTFVSATAPVGWTASTPTVGTNGTVTFTIASFPVGTANFTVVANVACSVTGTLSATATSSSSTTDPTPGNNMGGASTTVTNAAPTVTCPANASIPATGPSGATYTFTTPTPTDDSGCSASTVCSPVSGTTFPVGVTTVTCTATDAASQTGSCSFTVTVAPFTERDTPGVYSSTGNAWFLRNTNTGGNADLAFNYGGDPTYVAIKGDWDGNGTDTPGLYNPATGAFFLRNSNSGGPADITFLFGAPNGGFTPISGDWDNNGTDTIGLYNPTTGAFFLRNTNSNGSADLTFFFGGGGAGYLPIAGDWDNANGDSIGLYNPTTGVFFLKNANANGNADFTFQFGVANGGYLPIAGDWNGDGTDGVGLYQPSSSAFFLTNMSPSSTADYLFFYGPTGLKPLAGNWDGL